MILSAIKEILHEWHLFILLTTSNIFVNNVTCNDLFTYVLFADAWNLAQWDKLIVSRMILNKSQKQKLKFFLKALTNIAVDLNLQSSVFTLLDCNENYCFSCILDIISDVRILKLL